MNKKRLFIVANRLPITIDAQTGAKPCSGGLVSAINSYLKNTTTQNTDEFEEVFWAGVPGCSAAEWGTVAHTIPDTTYTYMPVFINKNKYEGYYNGFSNTVLWPLFHYFPSYAEYSLADYDDYLHANTCFLETLSRQVRPNDVVWIHDYHLLPLAGMLRKVCPQVTIGFFLHIPFPSFEIVRLMPRKWQEELLSGMLGADLVGFHTIDYASHFLHSIQMVLGLDNDMHIIRHDDRLIKIDVFPISIDFKHFNEAYDGPTVRTIRQGIQKRFTDKKIIFSVDRLDYTKGVFNRLKAYEHFLLQNPKYHEKVVFIIVVVPSRDTLSKYAERKRKIDETISTINSKIGNLHWQPVIYQYNSLTFERMVSLYTVSHLALITPLRDGMNLVAKEFVASRKDGQGVLVISEMAGAARELTDALTINPNDILEMAEKIKIGLEMSPPEQQYRMEAMQERIASYDVQAWAEDFLTQLNNIKKKQQEFQVKFLDEYSKRNLFSAYRSASRRLLLLDYDGTLVPFSPFPSDAKPSQHLIELVSKLSNQTGNDVFIISGRKGAWLEKWFCATPVNIIAEHGAQLKLKSGLWTSELPKNEAWKEGVQSIMETYVRRCAHSFIEVKDFSIVWHYRNANAEQAKLRSLELLSELNEYTHNLDLQVMQGNKIVEVRKHGINKGTAIKKILVQNEYDFILAVGDDHTDEDMFKILAGNSHCFTIKVGPEASFASYNLHTPQMVLSMLDVLSHWDTVAVA